MSNQTLPLSEPQPNSLIVDKKRLIDGYKGPAHMGQSVQNHLEQNKLLSNICDTFRDYHWLHKSATF